MAVLNFVPKNSINEKQVRLAEYFASQEIRDFEETISILKENSSLSYLFNNLDFIFEFIENFLSFSLSSTFSEGHSGY